MKVFDMNSVHTTHSTHAAHATTHCRRGILSSGNIFDDNAFRSNHERSNWSGIEESNFNNLGGVDNTSLNEVTENVFGSIITKVVIILFEKFSNDNSSFFTSIFSNSLAWNLDGLLDNLDTNVLIEVFTLQGIKWFGGIEQSATTTNDDTFFNGSFSSAESISDSVLDLTNFNFGSTTNLNDTNSSSEFSESLLELFLVVFGSA